MMKVVEVGGGGVGALHRRGKAARSGGRGLSSGIESARERFEFLVYVANFCLIDHLSYFSRNINVVCLGLIYRVYVQALISRVYV